MARIGIQLMMLTDHVAAEGTLGMMPLGARDIVRFAEIGQGALGRKPVIDQRIASGGRHLLIEQDQTRGRGIVDSLAMSREHPIALGYEPLITG